MPSRSPVQILRTTARRVRWPLIVILTLNVEKLAEHFGWDEYLVAIFGSWSPAVDSVLGFLQSPWVQYPAVFLLGLTIGVWLDARLWSRERRTRPGDGAAPPLDRRLYLGRTHIDVGRLLSDFHVEFSFIAFNGTADPLRLIGVRGSVSYGSTSSAKDADLVRLPAPTVREDNAKEFPPLSEFMVIISQPLRGAVAAQIDRDLSTDERVMFVFDALHIEVTGGEGAPVRLPIWERVTCERTKRTTLVRPIAMLRAQSIG